MRRTILGAAAAAVLAAGCSSKTEPTQPKLTDEQIKEVMKQGKEQQMRETGGRGSPGVRP